MLPNDAFVSIQLPEDALPLELLPLVPVVPLMLPLELLPDPDVRHPVTVTVSLRLLLRLLPDCPLVSCVAVDCAAAVHTARANAAAVPNTCERFINMPPMTSAFTRSIANAPPSLAGALLADIDASLVAAAVLDVHLDGALRASGPSFRPLDRDDAAAADQVVEAEILDLGG